MKKFLSIACLFLTAMIWGFAFVFQAKGAETLGGFSFNGTRFLIGTISLIPVALIMDFKKFKNGEVNIKKFLVSSLICGTVLFIASNLQQFGVKYTASAGLSGFITAIYIVLTPIMYFVIFRQKTKIEVWLSAFLALFGLSLLCFKQGEGLVFGKGELLLLIGAFFWAGHMIVVDRFAKDFPSVAFSFGQFFVCSAFSMASMFIFERGDVSMSLLLGQKWSLLYCGVMSVGIAYTLQIVGQKRTDPTFAAIVFSLESVFSAIGGALWGIDHITLLGYLGCALIFAGIIFSQLNVFKKKDKSLQ